VKSKYAKEDIAPRLYMVQLGVGYSLDGKGKATSIWLSKEDGEKVLKQLGLLVEVDTKKEDSGTP
jgi:hypothetical protein